VPCALVGESRYRRTMDGWRQTRKWRFVTSNLGSLLQTERSLQRIAKYTY